MASVEMRVDEKEAGREIETLPTKPVVTEIRGRPSSAGARQEPTCNISTHSCVANGELG
jgi:hypothetical protein